MAREGVECEKLVGFPSCQPGNNRRQRRTLPAAPCKLCVSRITAGLEGCRGVEPRHRCKSNKTDAPHIPFGAHPYPDKNLIIDSTMDAWQGKGNPFPLPRTEVSERLHPLSSRMSAMIFKTHYNYTHKTATLTGGSWSSERDSNPHNILPTYTVYRSDVALPLCYPMVWDGQLPVFLKFETTILTTAAAPAVFVRSSYDSHL